MFKINDTVVPAGNNWGKSPNAVLVVELDGDMHFKGRNFTGLEREYWYMVRDWRLATPEETKHKCRIDEEIASGHLTDKCKCVATRTYENGTCNKCGLQDMGEDSDLITLVKIAR